MKVIPNSLPRLGHRRVGPTCRVQLPATIQHIKKRDNPATKKAIGEWVQHAGYSFLRLCNRPHYVYHRKTGQPSSHEGHRRVGPTCRYSFNYAHDVYPRKTGQPKRPSASGTSAGIAAHNKHNNPKNYKDNQAKVYDQNLKGLLGTVVGLQE